MRLWITPRSRRPARQLAIEVADRRGPPSRNIRQASDGETELALFRSFTRASTVRSADDVRASELWHRLS